MPRGRKGSGVELRRNSIRVSFTWGGKRCRETLDLKPTPPNARYAERVVAEIRDKIARGTFVYADYFPRSPRAASGEARSSAIRDVGELWLATKGQLSAATKSQYRNALAFWYGLLGADADIRGMRHGEIAAKIGAHRWSSAKLFNNYLVPLRGVFLLAQRDRLITDNPLLGVANMRHQRAAPDPFTLDEAEAIVDDMRARYHAQVWNYFEFMFFSGLRPEEAIALLWADIGMDDHQGYARVERAKSFRGVIKPVKTYQVRDVELLGRAQAALLRQGAHTRMKSIATPEKGWVFENPVTGRPWHDERSQRDHYWTPTLRRLKIRYRAPYNTRHTYATLCLMAGANPAYISRQLGHRSAKMLFEVYAKWIDRADRGREREKIEATLRICPPFVPGQNEVAQDQQVNGRRDWNRITRPVDSSGNSGEPRGE